MASNAEKLDLDLWEQARADAREKFGGHSARAMQYAVKLYKARGGRYKGPRKADNRLVQWTRQDWTTKSGRPSRETGERYLPRAAIESLTAAEYGATSRAKRRGGGVGKVVAQPQSIREKTRKFRKVNPMATPAQIAARERFAERARSGELAKMRKKATRKSNPMVISKQADSSLSKYGSRGYLRKMLDDYSDLGHVVAVRKKRTGGMSISLDGGRALTPEQARKKLEDFFGYAKNPAKTVSEEISRQVRKGKPQKQAVAIALEMERAGKLRKNPDGKKFVVGKYYETRLITDSDTKVGALILDRTEKSVTVRGTDNLMKTKYRLTTDYQGNEMFFPWGRFSMAPQIGADDERKSNPTATRAPARARTKLVSNGREKNPQMRTTKVKVQNAGGMLPFSVEAVDESLAFSPTMRFKKIAAFETKTQAQDYIDAILKSNPKVTLRIKKREF